MAGGSGVSFPSLSVEVGFATDASTGAYWHIGDAARGMIGTAAIGGDFWVDVTADVTSVTTQRGSTRLDGPIVRYDAGTCTIELLNLNRDYDPTNAAGPYYGQVTPMRAVRVRATADGTTYNVFRGFADSWTQNYDKSPNYATTTLTATDGFKVLARNPRVAGGSVGAGEDSGARVSRILDSAGWPAEDRMIAVGDSTLQATTLDGDPVDELQTVQDSEVGELYVDADGRVVFRNRLAILEDARSNTSQATFGDLAPELPYDNVVPEYDDTVLFNVVRANVTGGATQEVTDTASITANLQLVYESGDLLLQTDADALSWAGFVLHQTKDPELRFSELTINPRNGDSTIEAALFAQVLGREIGDRITVKRRPPGGGDPIERDVFVRGVAHTFSKDLTWMTTWTLQSATSFSFWTIGDPILGSIGDNAIAF